MTRDGIPPMAPLAPIVDRMRELAGEELPAPRTCKVCLWDDDTFDAVIYHSAGDEERQQIRYERTTGEIVWERFRGVGREAESLSGGETVIEPVVDETEVRVLARVEPPH